MNNKLNPEIQNDIYRLGILLSAVMRSYKNKDFSLAKISDGSTVIVLQDVMLDIRDFQFLQDAYRRWGKEFEKSLEFIDSEKATLFPAKHLEQEVRS